jgi:hypothetical protein
VMEFSDRLVDQVLFPASKKFAQFQFCPQTTGYSFGDPQSRDGIRFQSRAARTLCEFIRMKEDSWSFPASSAQMAMAG